MLTKIAARTTDATRRAALQIAVQLPEDVVEARSVLAEAADLLEGFLVRAPREIWNRPVEMFDARGSLVAHEWALFLTLAVALLLAPLAMAAAVLLGCEAASGWVLLAGVSVVALVFGQAYGVVFSIMAAIAHNYLVVLPAYEFSMPTRAEIVRFAGFVLLSVALPSLANGAARLRELALRVVGARLGSSSAVAPARRAPVHAAVTTGFPDKCSRE